ncbi:Indoleamine 2,3-dioxygenase nanC [Cladobotryum mycophilum]|uniref:Indoleamine 2,3-dioxygenase nanC n=1 Tax=Cladobotryum mycophilum TaxID=491253 RepID=A0ABR0S5G3_9HYPO
MSPHAIITDPSESRPSEDLAKFAVTKNAFLPEESPSTFLSDPYYEPWEVIAQHLPTLIESRRIHKTVGELPILTTERLRSQAEWRRAYVLLAFITHAHIWGGDKPCEILPPQITIPFLRVSAHLELPRRTESESWFFLISVAMEAKAGSILQTMTTALKAVKSRNYEVIIDALNELRKCIEGVGILLERMYEKCDPMTFYHKIRPFLAGTKNMEEAGLPKGVFYDEGDGKGEWKKLRGGSNGQSSLIQFFDVVLGVDHNGHGDVNQKSFHSEVREYMPGPHRRFLIHVVRMGSIRELALVQPVTDEQHRLRKAYTAATEALSNFRNKHIQIVTRYIILPSKQPWSGSRQNLASSSSARKGEELTGTGGTTLVPFLKQARDETVEAGKLERR